MIKKHIKCPLCRGSKTTKKGIQDGKQRYFCKDCKKVFRSKDRKKTKFLLKLWISYVFHKQTVRELHHAYELDRRTIKKYLDDYQPPEKEHSPRSVHLVVDATYFGERKKTPAGVY